MLLQLLQIPSMATSTPVWLIFITSSVFDMLAFGLALGAQSRRNKVEWQFDAERGYWYCKYSSDSASGMAVAAFFLLLLGHALVMAASRCFCLSDKHHKPGGNRLCAVLSLTFSWVFFLIAESILLAGANHSYLHTKTKILAGTVVPSCELIRSSLFAAGAAFTFLTWIISQIYCLFEVKSRAESTLSASGPTVGMTPYPQESPYSL